MRTILNRVCKLPGFVYGRIRMLENRRGPARLLVEVRPLVGSRDHCAGCGQSAPGYDRLRPRLFQFAPILGLPVFFRYAIRRVQCGGCGKVKVERVPWDEGKQQATLAIAWFLSSWARHPSWKETAAVFQASWDRVCRAMQMAVAWGHERMPLDSIETIGVEIAWQSGHSYLTLVYPLDQGCRRLRCVGRERKIAALGEFFDWFGKSRSASLRVVRSDLWKAYLRVVAERAWGQCMCWTASTSSRSRARPSTRCGRPRRRN